MSRMLLPYAAILLIVFVSNSCSCAEWSGLVGKFTTSFFGNNGFYDLPLTRSEASRSRPQFVNSFVKDTEFEVDIYCLDNNPHVCLLFNYGGAIVGLRVTHLKEEVSSDLSKFPFKYDTSPMFNSTNFMGYDAWYTNFLFTNPANLRYGAENTVWNEDEIVRRNSKGDFAEGLWIRFTTGWQEIPRDECAAQEQGYTKQGFIPWMGNHYSYGQLEDCSSFMPMLPIYNKGRLTALSFAPLGKHRVFESRDWFENVPSNVIPRIIPHGYETCLQSWTEQYSASSFHFYFTSHPRWIIFDRSATCK